MKIRFFVIICLWFCGFSIYAQSFVTEPVNKQIKEFKDTLDFSTPLNTFIAYQYAVANGQNSKISQFSSYRIKPLISTEDRKISDEYKKSILETTVIESVTCNDSVAMVISTSNTDSIFLYLNKENNRWVCDGEGLLPNFEQIKEMLPKRLLILRKVNEFQKTPTDTINFINYLKNNGKEPKQYILDALKNHKLVIYGEFHFRKNSWELLCRLIKSPEFATNAGTVFLELSKDAQPELNQFFNSKIKNPDIILNIFRKEELAGWDDKGMFDLLMALWDVNRPLKNKINVMATEYSRTFYQNITSQKQYDSIERIRCDRNEIMAETIENVIRHSPDKRNHLFIVGWGHAYVGTINNDYRAEVEEIKLAYEKNDWF
jgi:hypothetical protein